eukprot:1844117-Alexandrium_andersonii.AAC.1
MPTRTLSGNNLMQFSSRALHAPSSHGRRTVGEYAAFTQQLGAPQSGPRREAAPRGLRRVTVDVLAIQPP